MTKRNRKKRQLMVFFVFASITCLGLMMILLVNSQIKSVERYFGAADPNLSTIKRIQLVIQLTNNKQDLLRTNQIINRSLFTIRPDENALSVATNLESEGNIQNRSAFLDFLVYKGYDRLINAGEFYIEPGMNAITIAEKIHTSTGDMTTLTILKGWRVEEIARAMEVYEFEFTPIELINTVQHPGNTLDIPDSYRNYPSLEGFLAPGQYKVDKNMSLDVFLSKTTQDFDVMITPKMQKNFKKNGLSLFEAVTLASIVEKEAILPEEGPFIASVFYNRLAIGMKLESDPTVQYAVGWDAKKTTWWKNPLMVTDLQNSSKYNTYQHSGLPPAPICNPGSSALNSVAFPESTNYYYFRAACDNSGKHVFSETYEEHLQNSCQ